MTNRRRETVERAESEHPGVERVRTALKALIRDAGLSYTEIGEAVGVSASNLSSILNGNQHLRVGHVLAICDAAGGRAEDVFRRAGEGRATADEQQVAGIPYAEIRRIVSELVREEREERERPGRAESG